ncbi:MAG TPA: 2-oxo-4-hydroxy-4-carboxy-5-ureidoimidazoline decarboxylase [Dongiaceae bacterium]|jgi:2-oxo-4-hydroxy-4-carboxy-5-ureidoimidazoline decarboxylase
MPSLPPIALAEVNRLDLTSFVALFGDVAEHSPWVAERAAHRRPFADRDAMIGAFSDAVARAPRADQLELIRAHPDLAGRAAIAGALTDDSKREQAGAGLDSLTPEEFARFSDFNSLYKKQNGFPFIFAVKGATKQQILAAFDERVRNDHATEFATALGQVCRIFRFRIEDRVKP